MLYITSTEFKKRLNYYLELSSSEDIYITKNGRVISVLSDPHQKAFYDTLAFMDENSSKISKVKEANDELLYEALKEKYGIRN